MHPESEAQPRRGRYLHGAHISGDSRQTSDWNTATPTTINSPSKTSEQEREKDPESGSIRPDSCTFSGYLRRDGFGSNGQIRPAEWKARSPTHGISTLKSEGDPASAPGADPGGAAVGSSPSRTQQEPMPPPGSDSRPDDCWPRAMQCSKPDTPAGQTDRSTAGQ